MVAQFEDLFGRSLYECFVALIQIVFTNDAHSLQLGAEVESADQSTLEVVVLSIVAG